MSTGSAWLASGAVVLAFTAPDAGAQGFLDTDADAETVLVDARVEPANPSVRGTWKKDATGLWLEQRAAFGESTYLLSSSITDGLVRARWMTTGTYDVGLVLRAQLDSATAEPVGGYVLALAGGHARLSRWEHGVLRPLGVETAPDALAGRASMEVVALLAGPWIVVQLYDADTLDLLATLTVHDRGYALGRVGVRAADCLSPQCALVSLSIAPTGAPHTLAGRDTGAGPSRLVTLRPEDVPRLPRDLATRVVDSDGALLSLTPVQLERVRRAGVVPLAVSTDLPWRYADAKYRARRGRPPTALGTGFRLDESYKDAVMVEDLLRAYHARYPALTRLEELGRTHQGRPILALLISRNPLGQEDEPAVMLNAAHHGGELLSIEFVLDAIHVLLTEYRSNARVRRWVDSLAIWCVPLVNPDGNHGYIDVSRDYDRKNGRDVDGDGVITRNDGVDLYRNYPVRFGTLGEVGSRTIPQHHRFRGLTAASEPETQAMVALAIRERFAASVSFHTVGTVVLAPYTIPSMVNPEPDPARVIANEIVGRIPRQANGKKYTVEKNLYPVDGTDQDWLMHTFGTVALLVEGPYHNPTLPTLRNAAVAGTRPTWQLLFDRLLTGPTLSGHVRDELGRPVEAVVRVEPMVLHEGEAWTSRPMDGRFDRLLAAPGTYRVTASRDGFTPVTREVSVQKKLVSVDLVLVHARDGEP